MYGSPYSQMYGLQYMQEGGRAMSEQRDPNTGLTDDEFEAGLHFISKGYKIVDFSTEPADDEAE